MSASARRIPSVESLRQHPDAARLEARFGRAVVVSALRTACDALRIRLLSPDAGGASPRDPTEAAAWLIATAEAGLERHFAPRLRPVVNATGVIVHTNLGRAPLAEAALSRVAEIGGGYSNLEFDLATGHRGRRDVHVEPLLVAATGAEAALVVNNNAAATLLLVAALARGREVVVSRGELVEIGGGFRIPEIMSQSGAVLREVGTTNRTRVSDYAAAIGDRTALLLRVHPSNFTVEGFTERPDPGELVAIGRRFGIPVAEDLGSGNLLDLHDLTGAHSQGRSSALSAASRSEPTVQASVAAGFDVICFSGDKLLGGPQAGILVGRRDSIDVMKRHPLMRAFRADKLTHAALEATLGEYVAGRATRTVPVAMMLTAQPGEIEARARTIAAGFAAPSRLHLDIVDGVSTIGGGSAPGSALPTRLLTVAFDGESPDRLLERLRTLSTPIIGRIENDRVVLDLRTVLPRQDEALARLLRELAQ